MTTPPEPYERFRHYLRDVAIGFLLILGGIFLGGLIAEPFRNVTELAYPIGLWIGFAPFWWFARRQHVHNCDWYDYVGYVPIVVLVSAIRMLATPASMAVEIVLIALAAGTLFTC